MKRRIVEPAWKYPSSSPRETRSSQANRFGPRYRRWNVSPRAWIRMDATRIAATGTIQYAGRPSGRSNARRARSFLQNSASTRASATGFTFQVSPEKYRTSRRTALSGAWNRWYMFDLSRIVRYDQPSAPAARSSDPRRSRNG